MGHVTVLVHAIPMMLHLIWLLLAMFALVEARLRQVRATIVTMLTHARLAPAALTNIGVVVRLEVQAARPLVG